MRTFVSLAAGLALAATLVVAPPASAHGDRERLEAVRTSLLAEGEGSPVLSDNVRHLASKPGQVGISGCFMQTRPLLVTSGLETLKVWNVRNGTDPRVVGTLPNAVFENEAMNCGERRTDRGKRRFALIGVDLYQVSPTQIEHWNVGGGELVVVDVTDPTGTPHRRTGPGVDEHPHGRLRQGDQLPLRLLGR